MVRSKTEVAREHQVQNVPIDAIIESDSQPRKKFDEESLAGLAVSMKQHGLLQPIIVRPMPRKRYALVVGERRWRAARLAGWQEIPAHVQDRDDTRAATLALIENLHREDLLPTEVAEGIQGLIDQGLSERRAARQLGKSPDYVRHHLDLLSAPEKLLAMLDDGKISSDHVALINKVEGDEADKIKVAETACRLHWSVGQLRARTQHKRPKEPRALRSTNPKELMRRLVSLHVGLRTFEIPAGYAEKERGVLLKQVTSIARGLENLRRTLAAKT